jgi:hypothetical protein
MRRQEVEVGGRAAPEAEDGVDPRAGGDEVGARAPFADQGEGFAFDQRENGIADQVSALKDQDGLVQQAVIPHVLERGLKGGGGVDRSILVNRDSGGSRVGDDAFHGPSLSELD